MWYTKIESVKVVGVVDMKKKKEQEETLKNKDKKTEEELFKSLKENRVLLGDDWEKEEDIEEINEIQKNKERIKRKKKYPWQIYVLLLSIIVLIIGAVISIKYAPHITLKGEKNIILNYKEEYKEKGYKVTVNGKDHTNKIQIKGNVNTKRLGTYKLEYSYRNGLFLSKKNRTIQVKDLKKPIIMLDGGKEVYICPNTEYQDKYKAIDNYDGELTNKVKIEKQKEKYIYTVTDKAGNKTTIMRRVIKKDRIKPTITLSGEKVINIQIGQEYREDGYQALDNCDGDITSKVIIEKNVDINKAGVYEIKYKVKDNANNEAEEKRTINIVEPPKKGTIYLTFDDGPQEGTTNIILDILKEEKVPATFFVTNKGPDYLIKRAYDENHTIALHTASHNYAVLYASDEAYFQDLESVQTRVKNITGYTSKIIRFPGGSSNTISRKYSEGIMSRLTKEVLNRGYKYYDWNISSGDAGGTTSSEGVYQNVINNLRHDKVNMVLMHDIKPHTRDALRQIIQYAREQGYIFEKITDTTDMIRQRVNN